MKAITLLAALVLVSACGTDQPDAEPAAAQVVAPAPSPAAQPSPAVEPEPEARSLLVDDEKKMPPCNAKAEGLLVFVRPAREFRACLEGEWLAVDVRGKDGAAGQAGKDGEHGAAGKDGRDGDDCDVEDVDDGALVTCGDTAATLADGAKGDKGDRGEQGDTGEQGPQGVDGLTAAEAALGREWVDPDTGVAWYIAADDVTFAEAQGVCAAGFAIASGALPFKLYNYFLTYLSNLPSGSSYWSSSTTVRTFDSNGLTSADADAAERHHAICRAQ